MTDDRLRILIERIERIDAEIDALRADRRDVFAEGKAVGYNTGIMRQLIARRAMDPADRVEADMLLAAYEAAVGLREPQPGIVLSDRAIELAHDILAEQIAGIEYPAQGRLLVGHVMAVLDIHAEIALLRAAEKDRLKLADGEGFLAKHIRAAVKWFEKCAKHGEEAMRTGEAIYLTYRGTVDAAQAQDGAPLTGDPKLAAAFARPKPVKMSAKARRLAETLAWAGIPGE